MTPAIALEVTATPAAADRHVVGRGLGRYNRAAYGRLRGRLRWILARDGDGAVRGGAKCALAWDWLYLDWLWVEESLRRQGLGGRLLGAAEEVARKAGCLGVHLHTWSFQAPAFYPRFGYVEAGRIEDMPPGATRYWFSKRF